MYNAHLRLSIADAHLFERDFIMTQQTMVHLFFLRVFSNIKLIVYCLSTQCLSADSM